MGIIFIILIVGIVVSVVTAVCTNNDWFLWGIGVSFGACAIAAIVLYCNSPRIQIEHEVHFINDVAIILNSNKEPVLIQKEISKSLKPGDVIMEERKKYFDGSSGVPNLEEDRYAK
jgi:hypothetical protein